jgi:hypothetical protein
MNIEEIRKRIRQPPPTDSPPPPWGVAEEALDRTIVNEWMAEWRKDRSDLECALLEIERLRNDIAILKAPTLLKHLRAWQEARDALVTAETALAVVAEASR